MEGPLEALDTSASPGRRTSRSEPLPGARALAIRERRHHPHRHAMRGGAAAQRVSQENVSASFGASSYNVVDKGKGY
jgi:hypothetical protein